ncbi:response regulator [Nocardioides speluncae]|uniref:response regulator n=1 Tax=Nocardioides speluncae TaxID=2670337 RepID=UPI000D69D3CD|nr:response regulator transcription factor [Nocardioides speluncae]
MTVRVLIADDNPVVRIGLTSLLELEPDIEVSGEASSGPEALALAEEHRPDIVLLDVRMPGGGGLDVLPRLAEIARVLMLTYTDEPAVVSQALREGATGYLVHGSFDSHELAVAIRDTAAGGVRLSPPAAAVLLQGMPAAPAAGEGAAAANGGPPTGVDPEAVRRYRLSRRELEIAEQIVLGHTNSEIAQHLFIEEKTVKNHINRLFAKVGATNRSAAVALLLGLREDA